MYLDINKVTALHGLSPVLASYIGPASGFLPSLTHTLVTSVTSSIYSHSEIVLPAATVEQEDIGYTSSERDGGVRAKAIDFHDGKWHFVPLPFASRYSILKHYDRTKHHGYDFWGLRLFLGLSTEDSVKKDWCSEWCAQALKLQDTRISPGTLHRRMVNMYRQWLQYQQFVS